MVVSCSVHVLTLLYKRAGDSPNALFPEEIGRPPFRQPSQCGNNSKLVYPPSPVSKRASLAPLRVVRGAECVVTQVEPCQDMVIKPPDRVCK